MRILLFIYFSTQFCRMTLEETDCEYERNNKRSKAKHKHLTEGNPEWMPHLVYNYARQEVAAGIAGRTGKGRTVEYNLVSKSEVCKTHCCWCLQKTKIKTVNTSFRYRKCKLQKSIQFQPHHPCHSFHHIIIKRLDYLRSLCVQQLCWLCSWMIIMWLSVAYLSRMSNLS